MLKFVAEADAGDRVVVETADAVCEQVPGSFDLVVARHLFQVLSEKDNCALLKNTPMLSDRGGCLYWAGY